MGWVDPPKIQPQGRRKDTNQIAQQWSPACGNGKAEGLATSLAAAASAGHVPRLDELDVGGQRRLPDQQHHHRPNRPLLHASQQRG